MKLNGIASLRALLADMEADLGLHELTEPQRDILYAASLLSTKNDGVTTTELHQHSLVRGMTRSTFFRSLKALSDSGYLVSKAERSGYYVVGSGPNLSSV